MLEAKFCVWTAYHQGALIALQSQKNNWETKRWLLKKVGTTAKIHLACVSEKFVLKIQLSEGNRHGTPEG